MKQLGNISVLGMQVSVVITSTEEVGDSNLMSDDVHATFEGETNTIRLNPDSCAKEDLVRAHTLHEVVHSWFNHSGAMYFLRTQMPDAGQAKMSVVEETLVRMLTPALSSSLDDLARMFPRAKK